jgi:hypothetical protein
MIAFIEAYVASDSHEAYLASDSHEAYVAYMPQDCRRCNRLPPFSATPLEPEQRWHRLPVVSKTAAGLCLLVKFHWKSRFFLLGCLSWHLLVLTTCSSSPLHLQKPVEFLNPPYRGH